MLEKFGIGIDVVDVERFSSKQFSENEDFYGKIFNDYEIQYCLKFKNPYPHFAGKFALKEAVIKAINKKIDFLDILTDHLDSKPIVSLLPDSSYNFLVSVSHEKLNAIAVVISEKCN